MAAPLAEEDDDDVIAAVNIVPFVDIVLVLLIIFLLTSNIIARGTFPIDLPRAAHGGEQVESTLNIVVAPSGEIFADGALVTRDALTQRAHDAVGKNPRLRAVLAADKSLRYEAIIDIIDLLKGEGVAAVALNIERGPKP
jgi:biopolymer transport protein ExbD